MIVKPELIKKLKGYFDLNIYETKVWLALLSKGVSSAGEIAELSGVPRSRTYDVLESLEKRGFVIQKLGKPVKYIAVKPKTVIEKLKNNTVRYAEDKVKTLSNLKDTTEYRELEELHNTSLEPIKNHELSTSIKGRSNLYVQMRGVMESAEKSVYLASSAYELMSKQKMFSDVFAKLKKRKVDIKIIVNDNEDEATKISKKLGVPVKTKPLNSRFVVVDRTELIFTIKPTNVHEDFDCGVWINSPFFTNSMAYMFDLAWKD
jgi:HTH-type transcriptional regulator, sugar sensing transcriptional regulator